MEKIRKQITGKGLPGEGHVFRESEVVSILARHLRENGWKVKEQVLVEGGSIDIGAEKGGKILLIEAKGEDRGGYISADMNFHMGLGQLMSRMKHTEAEYGLAFPLTGDFIKALRKHRGSFAFEKLGIHLISVNRNGSCRLVPPHDVLKFLDEISED